MPRPTKTLSFATLVLAAFSLGAVAQTVDAHHPAKTGEQPEATQPANQVPADQMGAMMQGMMAQMPMMQMMKAMQGQDAMGGLDLTERVEGRIAFLKAELAITDKQAATWNAFADALRASALLRKRALKHTDVLLKHRFALLRGLLLFYIVCSVGLFANVGVAFSVYDQEPIWWLAGAAGALMGVVWNYAMSGLFVWRKR